MYCSRARAHCEDLWNDFRELADQNFKTEFASCTHARWFEMYLTVSLVRAGHEVTCPKPGPDILLQVGGRRIWIEAVCATSGESGRPDSVPRIEKGRVYREPTDQYVLRIRNALDEKQRKYQSYKENDVVSVGDVTVIAVNVYEVDGLGPHIGHHFLRSLYGIGDPIVYVGRDRGGVLETGNVSVEAVRKSSGADVGVRPFVDNSMGHISAVLGAHGGAFVLGAHDDAFNRTNRLGDDFVMYPNLTADSPWPEGLLRVGKEWCFHHTEGSWEGSLA